MKLKKVCSLFTILMILGQSYSFADSKNEIKEQVYINKNEVKEEIIIDNIKYELQEIRKGEEIIDIKESNVEKMEIITVNKKEDIENIKNQYKEINYKGDEGEGKLFLQEEQIEIKENSKERYWETATYSEKTVEGYKNYGELPSYLKEYKYDGLNYKLIEANFIPIGYNNDNTPVFKSNLKYGAVVPHYEKEIENYEVTLKYKGSVSKEIPNGYKTIAVYKKVNSYVKEVIGAIAGVFVVFVGFLLRKNVLIYSNDKRIKGYRKSSKKIEIDITKEIKNFNNLEIVIKKSLAKKLNNTYLIVKDNDNIVIKTMLNNRNEDIKIKL